MPRSRLTPEARLARYWRRRSKLQWSDFDVFSGATPPEGASARSPHWIFNPDAPGPLAAVADMKQELAHLIMQGYPLSFAEYHLAIAFSYLLADGIPYEEFYKQRWHETADRRGYGPLMARRAVRDHARGTTA